MTIKNQIYHFHQEVSKVKTGEELDKMLDLFWQKARQHYRLDTLDKSSVEYGKKVNSFTSNYGTVYRKIFQNELPTFPQEVVEYIKNSPRKLHKSCYRQLKVDCPILRYLTSPSFLTDEEVEGRINIQTSIKTNIVKEITYEEILELEALLKQWFYSGNSNRVTMALMYFVGRRPVEIGLLGNPIKIGFDDIIAFNGFAKKRGKDSQTIFIPTKIPADDVVSSIEEIQAEMQLKGLDILGYHNHTRTARELLVENELTNFPWIDCSYDLRALYPTVIVHEVMVKGLWKRWLDIVGVVKYVPRGFNNSSEQEFFKYLLSHESGKTSQDYFKYKVV